MREVPEDWFYGWVPKLMGRVRDLYGGWPPEGDPWWDGILSWMHRARVRRQEADQLLDLVQEEPPENRDKTIKALKAALKRLRAERQGADQELDEARASCREAGCECGGMGLVSRDWRREGYGGYAVSYYCDGPMGYALEAAHRIKKLDRIRPIRGTRLEAPSSDAAFLAQADPRHVEIGRWFQRRQAARAAGMPDPPKPAVVEEIDRRARERRAQIDRPKTPPQAKES